MGIASRFKDRITARQDRVRKRKTMNAIVDKYDYADKLKDVKVQLEAQKAKNKYKQASRDLRAQKLAPLKKAVGSFKQHAKKAAARQRQTPTNNKNLFGSTKNADELLFGTKPAVKKQQPKKKKQKVYFEYK